MKDFMNKILDTPKLIRTIWILLWIILGILLVFKFCFNQWYPIVVKNQNLLEFNDYICNSWVRYLIMGIFYLLNANLLYLISCVKKKYENIIELIVINVLNIINFIIKIYYKNFAVVLEITLSMLIPIIYLLKTHKGINKWLLILYPIIIQLIVMGWQLNIYLVRGIDFAIDNDNHILIGIILQIDYYIFLIITWIGVSFMGLFGYWFFTRDITVLKAEKQKELSKEKPNMKKINSIDVRIAELEKESK